MARDAALNFVNDHIDEFSTSFHNSVEAAETTMELHKALKAAGAPTESSNALRLHNAPSMLMMSEFHRRLALLERVFDVDFATQPLVLARSSSTFIPEFPELSFIHLHVRFMGRTNNGACGADFLGREIYAAFHHADAAFIGIIPLLGVGLPELDSERD